MLCHNQNGLDCRTYKHLLILYLLLIATLLDCSLLCRFHILFDCAKSFTFDGHFCGRFWRAFLWICFASSWSAGKDCNLHPQLQGAPAVLTLLSTSQISEKGSVKGVEKIHIAFCVTFFLVIFVHFKLAVGLHWSSCQHLRKAPCKGVEKVPIANFIYCNQERKYLFVQLRSSCNLREALQTKQQNSSCLNVKLPTKIIPFVLF